jgi:hypothetical protein
MVYYRAVGDVPPKRHTQHRGPEGRLYREELMGEEGFSSDSSLLYHRGVPSAIVAATAWQLPDQSTVANHPLTPRHLQLHKLFGDDDRDLVDGRRLVLGNSDVRLSYVVGSSTSGALPQRRRRRVRLHRERGRRRRDGVRGDPVPDRRLRADPARHHPPVGPRWCRCRRT